jgi:hypothetical protein
VASGQVLHRVFYFFILYGKSDKSRDGGKAGADLQQAGCAFNHAGSDAQHDNTKNVKANVTRLGVFDKGVQQQAQVARAWVVWDFVEFNFYKGWLRPMISAQRKRVFSPIECSFGHMR